MNIPGIGEPFSTTREGIAAIARKYVSATWEAGQIYRHIKGKKGAKKFIPEVSMDETDAPQTPPELLVILALLGITTFRGGIDSSPSPDPAGAGESRPASRGLL